MTTFYKNIVLSNGSSTSVTQNVSTGDSVVLTVYTGSGSGSSSVVSTTNCTSSSSTINNGQTTTISNFSSSSYSVSLQHSTPQTVFYNGTLSGTVSTPSDTEVDSLSFGADITGAGLNGNYYRYDQITGINATVTFSKTSGDAGFAWTVSNSTVQPTSGWTTSSINVSNNQYVHLRLTASGSYSTTRSATFSIGSPAKTDTISISTSGAPNTTPTGWNDLTLGDKSGVNLSSVWYLDFDGTFTTVAPGAGFTMSGLGTSITVSTSGTGDEIRKNSGSWTTSNTTFSNGDVLYARITASSSYSSGRTQTLGAGGGSAKDWTLTTKGTPTPSAFDLGDTSNTAQGTSYNSSTITLAGLDSGQSVTVSVSSNSSNYGYYKNGTLVASNANTTGVNGDQFYVSHVTNTGNGTTTTTTLTAGSTSDSFITTNSGSANTGWTVSKGSPTGTPNEGDVIGMSINAPLGQNENFWWSVSPTDVNASTGSGTTSNNPATKGVPAYNIGGFNFTPNVDYTDDDAAGTGPYNYTVNVYNNSARTSLVATTTVAVNDTSQPLPPDAAINAIGNQTFAYAAGSDNGHSITIGGSDGNHNYYDVVVNGTTTPVYGTEIGNGTLEVADDNIAPGDQTTFRVYARRPTANNGDNSYYDTSRTYTVSRKAQTPSISAALASNPNDDDVTINWTISNGDGGTLQYSTDNVNWTNGSSFAQGAKRGTAYTLYARTNATVVSDTASGSFTPGYNAPDAAISAIGGQNLAYGSTSTSITIANGSSIDEYFVYNAAGTVSYGGRTGNGTHTFNHGVAAGGSGDFRVYVRRPILVGGDNGFDATNVTSFTLKVYPNNVSLSVSDNNAEAASVTVTLSATGGEGGTIEYAKTSYSATTQYAQNRNTTVTYYARSNASNGLISQVSSVNHSVGYIAPQTYTRSDFTVLYNTAEHYDVLTSFPANDNYEVLTGGYTGTLRGSQSGGGGSSSVIAVTNINSGGDNVTYYIRGYRAVNKGGDGNYDNMDTYIVGEFPQASTVLETFTDQGTEAASGTFTTKITPGTGANTVQITLASNYASLQGNNTNLASVARAGDTVYVRTTGGNGLVTDSTVATPATYLNPPTVSVAGVLPAATDTTHTISTGSTPNYINYRVLSSGTVRGSNVGGQNITVSDVTTPGSTLEHTIQGQRPLNKGGNNGWVEVDTYNSRKYPGAPTTITITGTPTTESATASFTVTASGSLDTDATYTVSNDNSTFVANGGPLDLTRVQDTIYALATGENGISNSLSATKTVPHLAPKAYTLSNNDTENIAANTSQFAVGHSNTDTDHSYRVLYGSSTPNTDAGSRTGNGNIIIDGAELPAKGYNMNYATQVKRGLDSGGNNQWVETSTFTKRRFIDAPTITVGDDSNAGTSVTVTVTSSAVSNVTSAADAYQVQGDPEGDGTFTSYVNMDSNRQGTFTQNRNVTTADYRVKAKGANGLETTATYSNYDPGYLLPDDEVGFQDSTLTVGQNDTQAIVVLSGVARPTDTIAIRTENGSTNLKTGNASSGGAATIQFPHGLSIGGSNTYEIFTLRDTSTGGDGVTYYETNDTFTVERLDTTADAITFGSDLTTVNLSSVHYATEQVTGITAAVTVSSANGSSIPFYVSANATPSTTASDYNNTNKTINNNEYIHLRAVASGSYSTQKFVTISVGDPAVSATWRVTTKANVAPFDLGDAAAPREINTTYTSNTITISGLNTGQTASASVSGGQLSKNGGAFAQVVVTVQNGDTLQVRGTSSGNYDGSTVNVTLTAETRSDTFSITTETKPTTPTGITIANDTTTTSASVSLQATAAGGTGGTLRISEDDSTYDADEVANFTFTRGTPKILYAKRFGTYVNSDLFTRAAFTLAYIPPDTSITASPSSPTASSVDMTVSISGGDSTTIYYVYNSSKTTLLGFRTGNGTITFTDAGLADGTTGTYAVQAKRPVGSGGDNALTDTGVTFQIAFDSNTANTPPSISVSASNSTPAVSTQVTLSATASDSDGSISSISWTQVGGPTTTPSPTSSSNSTTLSSTITTPSSPTTLRYKATATDNDSDTTDSSILVIEVGGGGEYGFEVFNSSSNKVLSVSSSVPRLVASGNTGTISWSSSPATINTTVSVSGLTNDGTWKVLIYTPYFNFNVSHEVSLGTGQFTVITTAENNAGVNQSLTMYYYVIRI